MDESIRERLWSLFLAARMFTVALRIWRSAFTAAERDSYPGGVEAALRQPDGVIGVFAERRQISFPHAIVKAYRESGQIFPQEARYLLESLPAEHRGEVPEISAVSVAEECIAAGKLVFLDYFPYALYWHGSRISFDWCARQAFWRYLRTLALQARNCRGVDRTDFGSRDPFYPSKMLSRLVNSGALPLNLSDLIQPSGNRSQRLYLSRDDIRIFVEPPTARMTA